MGTDTGCSRVNFAEGHFGFGGGHSPDFQSDVLLTAAKEGHLPTGEVNDTNDISEAEVTQRSGTGFEYKGRKVGPRVSSNRSQNICYGFNGRVAELGRDVLAIKIVNRSGQNRDVQICLTVHDGQMALEGKSGKDVGETGYLRDGPYGGLVTTT